MKTKIITKRLLSILVLGGIFVLFVLVVERVEAQNKEKNSAENKKQQPEVNIKVNKQRDKNGNIIRYDSTYISKWSGNGKFPQNFDSVFRDIHKYFKNNNFMWNDSFVHNPYFLNDSNFFSDNGKESFNLDFKDIEKVWKKHFKMDDFFNNKNFESKNPDSGKQDNKQDPDSIIPGNNGFNTPYYYY